MIVFVERRAGMVTSVFANPQPGNAEEAIDDRHPDVVAFRNPPLPRVDPIVRLTDGLEAAGVVNKAKADALKTKMKA